MTNFVWSGHGKVTEISRCFSFFEEEGEEEGEGKRLALIKGK